MSNEYDELNIDFPDDLTVVHEWPALTAKKTGVENAKAVYSQLLQNYDWQSSKAGITVKTQESEITFDIKKSSKEYQQTLRYQDLPPIKADEIGNKLQKTREIYLHNNWEKVAKHLESGKIRSGQFKDNLTLILKARNQLIDNIRDLDTSNRLIKPFNSLVGKVMKSKLQNYRLKKIAPELHKKVTNYIKEIRLKYSRDQGLERDR